MEFRKTALADTGIDKSFWKDKRVLLTGHTGFKGSWLSSWLQNLGSQVVGYSLPPPTTPSLFDLARLEEGMVSVIGDVCNYEALKTVFDQYQPEIVFHLAAQSLVRYSYLHPVETYSTNIMGTVHVLEALRRSEKVRVGVIVTSDKCYENEGIACGHRENDRMGGRDPYSSSKGCSELIVSAYRSSYFRGEENSGNETSVATVRAGNVIGGGDWAKDRLIPDMMKAFLENRTAVIRNPAAIRPWQHVLDPLSGYLILAERLWDQGTEFGEGWNFGPGEEDARPVSWVAETAVRLWGERAQWELIDPQDQLPEAVCLKLDCSKAGTRLGWSPRLRLAQALDWTIEWYKEFGKGGNMRLLTEEQIKRFEGLS